MTKRKSDFTLPTTSLDELFSSIQVYDTVLKLLEQWQRKRERDKDAR